MKYFPPIPTLCLAAAIGALVPVTPTSAEAVYRCGNAYSHVPCPGGQIVEATDPRSAAQRAEARRIAAQERRRAATMERERRALERRGPGPAAAGIRPPPPADGDAPRKTAPRSRAASGASASESDDKVTSRKTVQRGNFIALKPQPPRAASAPAGR